MINVEIKIFTTFDLNRNGKVILFCQVVLRLQLFETKNLQNLKVIKSRLHKIEPKVTQQHH